eukprot:6177939-Alexandrium_andersonii.AAC.1
MAPGDWHQERRARSPGQAAPGVPGHGCGVARRQCRGEHGGVVNIAQQAWRALPMEGPCRR